MVLAALATARRALPAYSHVNSPKTFTQHQWFACLVLKAFLKADYRGAVAHLRDNPSLVKTLQLKRIPHFTTLQKAARRLLASSNTQRLLAASIRLHQGRRRRVRRSAIDSTGLECSAASGYFVTRRKRVTEPWKTVLYHRYPKLSVVCDTRTHFILAFKAGRGPRPDVDEFRPLVAAAQRNVQMQSLVGDAGFDSESNHRFARNDCGIRTVIPAKHGRPTSKPASGHFRRLMQTRFDLASYRQRSQVETVVSMIKRRQGAHVRARAYHAQCRDLRLMALAHNVMIIVFWQVFYRAGRTSF